MFEVMEYEEVDRESIFREAVICSDTFTEFLFRFWIENTIWYSLHKNLPLSQIQEEYRNEASNRL
jgi:hypothetical protein